MNYGKYTFLCKFVNSAQLPYYKGSTFRGVFGIALKKIACTLKNSECGSCLLNTHCIYALVFETDKVFPASKASKTTAVPHPFVIEPPLTEKTSFNAGDSFEFSILLFGEINKKISYFIYALNEMGIIGVGKKINHNRGRFELETVSCDKNIIYKASEQKISLKNSNSLNFEDLRDLPDLPGLLNLPDVPGKLQDNSSLSLILETPLRLKFKNRLSADLPFHILVRAMLRRVSSLLESYGQGEPDIDYKGLVKRAENITVLHNNLEWFDWKRYSSRQNAKMLMGGITGSITYTYKGKLEEFEEYLPLFRFCSKTHIGKQTAFGLGKFRFEVVK